MDSGLIIKIVVTAFVAIVGIASTFLLKMKEDNPLEEIAEEVVKQETGLGIDFTPNSPEKEKYGSK